MNFDTIKENINLLDDENDKIKCEYYLLKLINKLDRNNKKDENCKNEEKNINEIIKKRYDKINETFINYFENKDRIDSVLNYFYDNCDNNEILKI